MRSMGTELLFFIADFVGVRTFNFLIYHFE